MSLCQSGSLHVVSLHHVIPSPSTSLATRHWLSRSRHSLNQHPHSNYVRSSLSCHRHFSNTCTRQRPRREQKQKTWTPIGDDFIQEGPGNTFNVFGKTGPANRREDWQIQKSSLQNKFKEGWNPRKKLSPDAQDGIRALNAQQPDVYTTEVLAQEFQVSPEAIRRILKSKWRPTEAQAVDRHRRWENRGLGIWAAKTAMGYKPPRKWREIMNEKVEDNGRDAAVELIRGPVAQAMLAHDIAMKKQERQERLRLQKQEEEAAMAARAQARSTSVLQFHQSKAAPKPRRQAGSRSTPVEEEDVIETITTTGKPSSSSSVNYTPEDIQKEPLLN